MSERRQMFYNKRIKTPLHEIKRNRNYEKSIRVFNRWR